MNIFRKTRGHILEILDVLKEEGVLPVSVQYDAVTAEPPRDASHGDIATNAALVISKAAGKNPRELAAVIKEKLELLPEIDAVEIAGPGFINIRLKNSTWHTVLSSVLKEETSYGNSGVGEGTRINVEYVSANPTGPMHIGHARGAVVGDVIARLLLKAGYDVTKEYYINDAGAQVDTLARSAYLRYREALGHHIGEIPEGYYPGEYLKIIGESFAQEHQGKYLNAKEEEWLPVIKEFALEGMMEIIKQDLFDLGIRHDIFTSEAGLIASEAVERTLRTLEKKGYIYQGVLEPPKGQTPEDWEPREQTLFRSTEFGDDIDRALKKSDGSYTYFASDIAYHFDKIQRGFNHMILCLGADHGGYVKRMQAAVKAMSEGRAHIDIVIYQLVNFLENGEPMKMSKRAGTFITVRDVVEAVGRDVVRFIMLTRKSDAVLDFDLKKVTEQSRDNPVFYVQYAHARCYSVLRNAAQEQPEAYQDGVFETDVMALSRLEDNAELDVIRVIAQWPRVVEAAAAAREPHRIAFYLQEVAHAFHVLWNKGKEDEKLRFLVDGDADLTRARLALIKACAITLASGMVVMGVEPVREL